MATIQTRRGRNGRVTYNVRIRVLGQPERAATFTRMTTAKQWASTTESKLRDGRYVPTNEAMRYTVA